MEAIIQFVQSETYDTAEQLAKEKLEQLVKKYEWLIRADVFFKEEKDTYGKGKICEIRLSCPGPRLFASANIEDILPAAFEGRVDTLFLENSGYIFGIYNPSGREIRIDEAHHSTNVSLMNLPAILVLKTEEQYFWRTKKNCLQIPQRQTQYSDIKSEHHHLVKEDL